MFGRISILFVLAVALCCCIPADVQAGPLGLFPNFHPGQRLASRVQQARENAKARRDDGKGAARLAPRNWRLFGGN